MKISMHMLVNVKSKDVELSKARRRFKIYELKTKSKTKMRDQNKKTNQDYYNTRLKPRRSKIKTNKLCY